MSQPIEIYLLDDDPQFLEAFSQGLEAYLRERPEECRIHSYTDGELLLAQAGEAGRVDLLISDICLESDTISGIGVGERMRRGYPSCGIIYLTSYLRYATEIYGTRPLYFILKEEYLQRIPEAMELFFRDREERQDTITVLSDRTNTVIPLEKLIYCEHIGRRTKLVCTDRELIVSLKIDELAAMLPKRRFIVSHKGYIVNLNYVLTFGRYSAALRTGQTVPISRSRYDGFRAAFANYLK